MKRPSFESIYLTLAKKLAKRSHHPTVKVGAVATTADNFRILSIGYNGYESGGDNEVVNYKPGKSGTIHAECNMAVSCQEPRETPKIIYVTTAPCETCARLIVNMGNVKKVIYIEDYRNTKGLKILLKHGIIVKQV